MSSLFENLYPTNSDKKVKIIELVSQIISESNNFVATGEKFKKKLEQNKDLAVSYAKKKLDIELDIPIPLTIQGKNEIWSYCIYKEDLISGPLWAYSGRIVGLNSFHNAIEISSAQLGFSEVMGPPAFAKYISSENSFVKLEPSCFGRTLSVELLENIFKNIVPDNLEIAFKELSFLESEQDRCCHMLVDYNEKIDQANKNFTDEIAICDGSQVAA